MSSQDRKDPVEIAQADSSLGLPGLDEQPGPAAPLSAAAQQALVSAALEAAFPLPPSSPPSSPSSSPSSSRLWARRGFLLGGSAAFLGAAATLWLRGRRPPAQHSTLEPTPAAAVTPAPSATEAPALDSPAAPDAATEPALMADAAPAPSTVSGPATSGVRPPSAKKASEASDWLSRANERRRQRRFSEAAALYEQVLSRYPKSDAAYVARVSAGMLYVERLRDPRRALRLFAAALTQQPRGALNEEARLGVADAFHALNRPTQERAALQDFLSHHPQALARAQVERRLRLLENR